MNITIDIPYLLEANSSSIAFPSDPILRRNMAHYHILYLRIIVCIPPVHIPSQASDLHSVLDANKSPWKDSRIFGIITSNLVLPY